MEIENQFLDRYLAKRMGTDEEFAAKLIALSRQGHLCMILPDGEMPPALTPNGPIVSDGRRYYIQKNWAYETDLLKHVRRLSASRPSSFFDTEKFETEIQRASSQLQPEQIEAIRTSLAKPFSLICGGPGTGKTYTAGWLVRILASSLLSSTPFYVALAAPTGKAASHLEKSIGSPPQTIVSASTLHSLLKRKGRIDAHLVIVDEGSMIDVSLWVQLLEKIQGETRLVILGDPDQLPPVEAGSLFSEMAPLFGVSLSRCMRTDVLELKDLAEAVRLGDADQIFSHILPKPSIDTSYLIERIAPWIGSEKPDPELMIQKYRRLGILNALRQGSLGVEGLQRQIFSWLTQQVSKNQWWAIPIMVTVNEPRLELYNGTFGVMIGQGTASLLNFQGTAYFPNSAGEIRAYPSPPPIEPAFCLSIHKSQGSEYEEVVALFPEGSQRLGREALYTAVTRAKKKLEIVGNEKTLREMLSAYSRRVSGFTDRFFQPVGYSSSTS